LIRHGRTTANAAGTLAGWTPGVELDEHGQAQATALAQRLAGVALKAVVTSPLQRCQQTADAIMRGRDAALHVDDDLGEVHYGEWTGQPLKTLARQPLWKVIQSHPSAAHFPGESAEGLASMQARAVRAVRHWNAQVGDNETLAVVSHGDVIKAILADALGLHLDLFQRIVVDPASLSVVRYGKTRPFVERINDGGGDVSALTAKRRKRGKQSTDDADVGGGAGPAPKPVPRQAKQRVTKKSRTRKETS
jgi:probable phosphomutase (TIGR03848 family)